MDTIIKSKGIYDGDTCRIVTDRALLISGEYISDIGKSVDLCEKYPNASVIDWSSQYLFPGLINTHVHLEFDGSNHARKRWIEESEGTRFLLSASNTTTLIHSGVTSVRDAGSSWGLLDLKRPYVRQLQPLPLIKFAGPPLTVTGGHLSFLGNGCETDSCEDMIRQVRIRKKKGCDAVKLIVTGGQMTPGSIPEHTYMSAAEIRAASSEAHNLNLPVFAHCLTTEGFTSCIKGGVDCIEHVACFKRNDENGLLERVYEPEKMRMADNKHIYFMMGLSAGYHNLDDFRDGVKASSPREIFLLEQEEKMFRIFKKCIEIGMTPVCGTDAGTPGTRFDETWLELVLMVERAGLKPEEAIRIGTVNSAKCLGIQTGELRKGYLADMITVTENPLCNIRALKNVEHIICQGSIVR